MTEKLLKTIKQIADFTLTQSKSITESFLLDLVDIDLTNLEKSRSIPPDIHQSPEELENMFERYLMKLKSNPYATQVVTLKQKLFPMWTIEGYCYWISVREKITNRSIDNRLLFRILVDYMNKVAEEL